MSIGRWPPSLSARLVPLDRYNNASGPHEVDMAKAWQYSLLMKDGVLFPPVRLVDYGASLMIIDGHHRVIAGRHAGVVISALIASGEAFEDLDSHLRLIDGGRADEARFWRINV